MSQNTIYQESTRVLTWHPSFST